MSNFFRRARARRTVTAGYTDQATGERRPGGPEETVFTVPVACGETRKGLNLRIILPGVRRADLNFRIEPGVLRLDGQRHPPIGFSEEGRCRFAMPYGAFAQDVLLPDGLDVSRMQAHLHEGVLDVHIPFSGDVRPAVTLEAGGALLDFVAAAPGAR
jgi:HSP20 family protein